MKLNIGYVGLSHLGINYAIAAAMRGFTVTCYDNSSNIISSLRKKIIPFYEKNTAINLKKKFNKFKFTNDLVELYECDLVFISQDVPTDSKGKSNLSGIKKLIKNVTDNINPNCNLIILCQVPPGFTRSINWPTNKLFYQVETLIFAEALHRAFLPERIIVGKNIKKINKKYEFFLKKFNCPILEMNYESAELAKISINIFLISSVTSSNIISEICERIGANWKDISNALKSDKRIGKYAYLRPGLGLSGGNLERDLETLTSFVKCNKIYKNYYKQINSISKHRKNWIYNHYKKIFKNLKNKKKIGILGLAYKENTNSIKNSPAISFIKKISSKNKVCIFDPKIFKIFKNKNIKTCKNINEVLKNSEILIIPTPWKVFRKINLNKYPGINTVIDPHNLIKISPSRKQKLSYFGMGNLYEKK